MKICKSCNVEVSDVHNKCPLCQGLLSVNEENSHDYAPKLPSYSSFEEKTSNSILSSVRLLILITGSFSVFLNLLKPRSGWWSLFVILTEAAFWWWISIAIKIKRNVIKKFSQMVFLWGTFAVVIDFLSGWHKWSLNYVVPIFIASSISIIMIIDKIMKISQQERVFYNFLLVITGLAFLCLMFVDIVTFNIPSYILLIVCIFSICHSVVFEKQQLVNELEKRFHI